MNRIFDKLLVIFNKYDEFILTGHSHIDLDSLGSCLGIYRILKNMNKKVSIYIEDEIDNTSVIKALEKLDLYNVKINFINKEEVRKKDRDKTLLIIIDTHNLKLLDQPWMYQEFNNSVVLDHHIKLVDSLVGNELTYINSRLSSMVEFVTLFLKELNVNVSPIVATIMLAGMEIDTNSYNIKTTSKTYEVASMLMRMGANHIDKQNLLQESMEIYKKRQDFIKSSYMINDNMAICTLNDEVFQKRDLAQIAEDLLQFDNVEAAFAIGKLDKNEVGISARSLGKIDVQKIMVEFNGGGHKGEAAAQISNVTINQVKEKLLEIIESGEL